MLEYVEAKTKEYREMKGQEKQGQQRQGGEEKQEKWKALLL